MKKIVLFLSVTLILMAHTHQTHITVKRYDDWVKIEGASSVFAKNGSTLCYSFNVKPASMDDAYCVRDGVPVYVKAGDIVYVKGKDATIKIAWTKG